MKVQRLRVKFTRGDELKYITHLDLMRFWERALRRADIPIAYSEGFSPHPQIALAAPLPVGVTSEAELMDVFLEEVMTLNEFIRRVTPQLPPSVRILRAEEAGLTLPALQAEVRAAEYEVEVEHGCDDLPRRIDDFMRSERVMWEQKRDDEVRRYDLRSLVHDIELRGTHDGVARLKMLLRSDSSGSGRPEQVAAALGLPAPTRIHRTRLVVARSSPGRAAWRRRGRFAS